MRICNLLESLPPFYIGMKHIAHHRPGPDDRDLYNYVVKISRLGFWQKRDLRTALDLKHPDSVALLQCVVNLWIVMRNFIQAEVVTMMLTDKLDRIAKHSHHPKSEKIYFNYLQSLAVILIPLNDGPVLHRRWLKRNDRIKLSERDHHPAGMLAEMTRK